MKSAATPLAPAPSAIAQPRHEGLALGARRPGRHALTGILLAGVLLALWVILYPHTPDLAGQVYRVGLFRHNGFIALG